jgi:peptide/nickel transport system substrate-binding protein
VPGQSITMTRFPGYWDTSLIPKAGSVKFVFIPDASDRINALTTGEVDGMWSVDANSFASLRASHAGTVYFGLDTTVQDYIVSNLKGPLGDPRVRQALLMATDRKGIIKAGDAGIGTIANSIVAPSMWGQVSTSQASQYAAQLATYPYDPTKARQLAAAAGVHGQTITIATSSFGLTTDVITAAISQAATAIGLHPVIRSVDPAKYSALFTDSAARSGFDLIYTSWDGTIDDPLDVLGVLQAHNYDNYGGYSNPALNAAIATAFRVDDPGPHFAAEAQADRIASEQLPWLPLYYAPLDVYLGKRITGVQTSINYLYYPWAAEIGAAQ